MCYMFKSPFSMLSGKQIDKHLIKVYFCLSCHISSFALILWMCIVIPLADYYVLGGVVYQCPDLWSIINSRLVCLFIVM